MTATSPLHPKAASSYSGDVQWRQIKRGRVLVVCGSASPKPKGSVLHPLLVKVFSLYHQEFGAFASVPIRTIWEWELEAQTGCGCRGEQNK